MRTIATITRNGTAGILAAGAVLSLVGAAGCSTDVNSRSTIGAQRELPAIEYASAADRFSDGASERAEGWEADRAEPAVRLDRGDWSPIEFRLPVDGTVHNALLLTEPRFGDEYPRAHGLYPTAETALDLGSDRGGEAARGVVEPVRALVDLAVMPVRVFTSPAWGKRQSPSNYKRWHSREWLAGPIPGATPEAGSGSGSEFGPAATPMDATGLESGS